MLFSVDVEGKTAAEMPHVTLSELQLKERYDLQEWVLQNPRILGEDLLVIASEFSGFDRTSERLDVLALDKHGVLTVIELKLSAMATAADLQALRYAAYCSTLDFADLTDLLAKYETRRTKTEVPREDAERLIRAFVDEPDFTTVTDKPRIILGAEEFSPEITATILWLRSFGVDASCVRLRPYSVENRLLLETSVLIPLPEAGEYQIRRDTKDAQQAEVRPRAGISTEEFLATVTDDLKPVIVRLRDWVLSHPTVREQAFKTGLTYRLASDRSWVTWLTVTRREVRAAIRPEVEVDPALYVRQSPGGWSIVRARTMEEAEVVVALIEQSMEYEDAGEPSR